ncbi:MAG: single-stranded-DNA-specific exonuclease RecJ [Candidatus Zapsychrus exili]|nr:single-stranded-DNA-specific exonuclease RecJ [Candidatus Zapsychrus exili]
MQKKWKIKKDDTALQSKLSEELGISLVVAKLLVNRGIVSTCDAKHFLYGGIYDLHDPYLMKDMGLAVDRIKKAKKDKERVLVHGDYDVDGVTSSALLINLLDSMGIDVVNYIPHRVDDGYGLNQNIGELAKKQGAKLVIAVDCGVTSLNEIDVLNSLGIDTIIIDHHEPAETLPKAIAVVDPKRKDCEYPFKHLASVGLVAKLIQAINGKVSEEVLNLTALGTVSDVVPLRGENRIFVKEGLANIHNTKNKGLQALFDVAKIQGKKIGPFHIGFVLGPRLNAAGRMDSAQKSLDLFLSEDFDSAYNLAKVLDSHNSRRQKIQREVISEAIDFVDTEVNFNEQKVIVLSKEGWHKGILGIAASRIVDKYCRPAIVISVEDGIGTASARSIDGFNLHEMLSACSECLEGFGGHKGAAGLTIKEEKINSFREMINSVAEDKLVENRLVPTVSIDCKLSLSDINMELADTINLMEPFGEKNPVPVFCSKNLKVKGNPLALGRDTLKFWVTDGKNSISAVGFSMAKQRDAVASCSKLDLAYEISIDDWNKAPTPQLKIKDIKIVENA